MVQPYILPKKSSCDVHERRILDYSRRSSFLCFEFHFVCARRFSDALDSETKDVSGWRCSGKQFSYVFVSVPFFTCLSPFTARCYMWAQTHTHTIKQSAMCLCRTNVETFMSTLSKTRLLRCVSFIFIALLSAARCFLLLSLLSCLVCFPGNHGSLLSFSRLGFYNGIYFIIWCDVATVLWTRLGWTDHLSPSHCACLHQLLL